jgi:TipAS antibiotic-recognition domain
MQSEVQDANEFLKNYYREEAWVSFKARHCEWPSHEWNNLFRDLTSSLTEDTVGPRAQALAARWRALRGSDSGGDPKVHAGLIKAWADRQHWPATMQSQFSEFNLDEISKLIERAFRPYRRTCFGQIVWVEALKTFSPGDRERSPLAGVDLHFKIEEALNLKAAVIR